MLQFYIKELIRTECLQDIQINGKDKHFSSDLTLRKKEKLCDAFASEMLLPSNVVRKIFSPDERISTSEV